MKRLSLINRKGAGRPAIQDRGIRHICRDVIKKTVNMHITIKLEKKKAGLKNKVTLQLLHKAIKKARMSGLRILHYTLEFDHIHLMTEADCNASLSKGMQSFGITFSKGINKIKSQNGRVYKHRYHLRLLKSRQEVRNVIAYILGNGARHGTSSFINQYNSLVAGKNTGKIFPGFDLMIKDIIEKSKTLTALEKSLKDILDQPTTYHGKQLC